MKLAHAKGTIILCEDGHEVGEVLRDLYRGDFDYSTAFGNFKSNQTIPKLGDPLPLRCYCGAKWFDKHKLVHLLEPKKDTKMKIEVLDQGYVSFVDSWGSDESIIEAARMSTGKGFLGWGPNDCPECEGRGHFTIDVIGSDFIPCNKCKKCSGTGKISGDEKLLAYLYNNKHSTPFEMAGVVIEVKAPIFVFREWHRHRTQSYNEMSARYIPLPDENYIPSIERLMAGANTATTNKQAQGTGKQLTEEDALRWRGGLEACYQFCQATYEEGIAAGIPKELARLPVPVARYSRMRASANLRNWLAFLTLRQAPAAQWEIREYANAVGQIIEEHFPRTWALYAAGK